MHLTLSLIVTFVLVLIIRWCVQRRRILKCLEKLPGPPTLPFFGNALSLKNSTVILPTFMEYTRKYGDITKVLVGPLTILILTSNYKFLEYILSSTKILNKGFQYNYLKTWLGNGLLTSDADKRWRKHRKIIAPTFNYKILDNFLQTFDSVTNVLIKKLKNEEGNPSFDVYSYINLCSLDVICETTMGTSINAQKNSKSDYIESVKTICKILIIRTFNVFLQYKIPYFFSKYYQEEQKAAKIIHDYTNYVIRSRRNVLDNKSTGNNNKNNEQKRKLGFLDLLLNVKEFDDNDVREEVNTFMFAGHDTSTSAISFTLLCLAEHQDVQAKVVDELREIFLNDKFRCATIDDLKEMKFLEAVIKEALRLYPPVPYINRLTKEDISYDGHVIPKGVTLALFIYGIHRNKDIFPEPEKFLPERFLETNLASQYPYGYIPFSAGPRNCIGQAFAMVELKSVLSSILRHYQILPAVPKHELLLYTEAVLLSKSGVHIRITKRNFQYWYISKRVS